MDQQTPEEELRKIAEDATAPVSDADVSRARLVSQFVIFPVAIILVGLAIYLGLGLLTVERKTAEDYLNTIRVGGINSRWQAAYELATVLDQEQREGRIGRRFVRELIRVFEASRSDDPRVRRFLAAAMGRVQDSELVGVLIASLEDPDDETRINAMFSLRAQGDPVAVPHLIRIASNDDAGLRKAAVYALGGLDDPLVPPALEQALHDRAPDVRWNAALQLAGAGNNAGLEVLEELLSPGYLEGFDRISGEARRNILVEAIRAVGMLNARSLTPALQRLREQDPDLRVRQAAIEILNVWGKR
ncbi:MAG: HEAT repeat domain-containing protein [Gemmatimonadetes bacterium]|nr:HEAT repeat domain-containing protein [Gemmatimonadota bacterium]MDE3256276.1 HEAT repeat domain-containing protein [Gemmatimonadota bacterium]